MKILVIGDLIEDHYRICKLKGTLCQEMPLPQLEQVDDYIAEGGAGLVAANLASLCSMVPPVNDVDFVYRTVSRKERIGIRPFNQWVCRLDFDATDPGPDPAFNRRVHDLLASPAYDFVVVSDYSKHSINFELARTIVGQCLSGPHPRPLFVDARHRWDWYMGAYAAFPNESEFRPSMKEYFQHVIHKAGAKGCYVDGVHIPTQRPLEMPVDICGAGDVFLAGFVSLFAERWQDVLEHKISEHTWLNTCASFANRVAGLSCEHFGTYVVKPSDLYGWDASKSFLLELERGS